MADGSIIIDTKIDTTGLDKQLSNLKKSISNTTDSLNNLTSKALIGFAALGAAITPAIKLASDLNESANAAKVVFGDATETITEFGKVAQKQAGLTSAEFNQMAAQIGAGLINAGQAQDKAAKQSVELTKRAADMASIFNTDVTEALTAIQAGLRGESEPLRRFAVGLDEAQVSAKAVEMGLAKSTSTVDAYGKSQARLALIMAQSSKFAGDFVNTSDQLANSTRITTAMIKEEAAQAGARLLPIVLDVIKGFLDWAKEGDRLAKIMQGMANAIKWAVESGFVQGVLAAVAAIKALTMAMQLLAAAASLTPLGALAIALGAVVGIIVTATSATDAYNQKLIENNDLAYENKEAAYDIIGPVDSLTSSQKLNEEQVSNLVKIYPQLQKELQAGISTIDDAKKAIDDLSEAQRKANFELASAQARQGISAEYEKISGTRKAIAKLEDFLSSELGKKDKGLADSARKNLARYQQSLAESERRIQEFQTTIKKLQEESFFGPGGFKPTAPVVEKPQPQPITKDIENIKQKTIEASYAFNLLQKAIKETKKIMDFSKPQDVFDEYIKSMDLAFQKTEDGAISWGQYQQAAEQAVQNAINALYAMGVSVKDNTPGAEFLKSLIASINAASTSTDLPKTGTTVIKRIAEGMTQATHFAQKAARKMIEVIGSVITEGIGTIEKIAGGAGSILSGIAEFDPKESYKKTKDFITGIRDFFETDLGAIPSLVDDILQEIVSLLEDLDVDKTALLFGNMMKSVIKSISDNAPKIIKLFFSLVSGIATVIIDNLPAIVGLGLQIIQAINQGIIANIGPISQSIMSAIVLILQTVAANLPQILEGASTIVLTMAQALLENIPVIIEAILQIIMVLIDEIVRSAPLFGNMGIQIVIAFITGIVGMIPDIIAKIVEMIPLIILGILSAIPTLIISLVTSIIQLFFDAITFKSPLLNDVGAQMIKGIGIGLENALKNLGKTIERGWNAFIQGVKDFFGIKSPSRVFAEIGGYMAEGIGVGINKEGKGLFSSVSGTFEEFNRQASNALVLDPTMKLSADAINSVMQGLSNNSNIAMSVAGQAAITATANQAIQITPAPVIIDGREVAQVAFRYTDSMVGAAFGT